MGSHYWSSSRQEFGICMTVCQGHKTAITNDGLYSVVHLKRWNHNFPVHDGQALLCCTVVLNTKGFNTKIN